MKQGRCRKCRRRWVWSTEITGRELSANHLRATMKRDLGGMKKFGCPICGSLMSSTTHTCKDRTGVHVYLDELGHSRKRKMVTA